MSAGRFLTNDPIEISRLTTRVQRDSDGAVVVFEGAVRNHHEGKAVESIFYDAYRSMAEREISKVLDAVRAEFPEVRIAVVHRLGLLQVGELSIAIACASPHRAEAFDACRAMIDRIKARVPIWKKEKSPTGEEWVGWQQ
jgi:molybdopterin synthase catalytic subunit